MMNNTNCFLIKLSAVLLGCYAATVSAAPKPASTNYVNSTLLGREAYGGVVFFTYLSGGVVHGLVAATADEPGGNNYDQQQAIIRCATKTDHGYSDWFLPNKAQISPLFNNRFAINPSDPNGGFSDSTTDGFYWTSTPSDNGNAFTQIFTTGSQDAGVNTVAPFNVRCIRAF